MRVDPKKLRPRQVVEAEPLAAFPERSIGALLRSRAERFGDKDFVRFRTRSGRWQELSFRQLDYMSRLASAGLADLGVKRGDTVLICAPNGPAVLVAELALLSLGAVSAPVYTDFSPELLAHCVRDSGARIALCGTTVQQHKLSKAAALEKIVVLDEEALPGAVTAVKVFDSIRQLPEVERERRLAAVEEACAALGHQDLAFLLYTSGTSGAPKGVELTHGNALSQQAAVARVWDVSERDVFLSYLPWHHVFGGLFERMMALWNGAMLVLDDSRGRDLDKLLANFREVKPTVYFSVPRVYQALIARARADEKARDAILHRGLRFVFTAAAPLPAPAYRFFEEAGVPVHEGWGLTESSPCATLTRPGEARESGVVGWPLPGTAIRLDPVELADPPQGEIAVRGPQVMRGYRNAPEESARALRDGWLHTGDVGEWTKNGLRVRGRVDGVFKLENGEKVSSAIVEGRLLASTPLLEQAIVLGDGQPFTTALCWISHPAARSWAEANGLTIEGSEVASLPELRRALTEALQAANALAQVPYDRVRRIALVSAPLAIESGELTPTLKVVRSAVMRRYAALIEALREGTPHPSILEIDRRGDAFSQA
ncbi:MAG TPA: AMP-binding protein [Myxococcales bacterium]|nr:AMP-binding protein [Myxococcales bacterium]